MSLRETLERIWADSVVRCPRHVVWWSDQAAEVSEVGKVTNFIPAEEGLFYAKGKRVDLDKPETGLKRREGGA